MKITAVACAVFVAMLGLTASACAQQLAPPDSLLQPADGEDGAAKPSLRQVWRSPVDPTRAVLVTPLFPGWGQLYSDNGWRAALGFSVQMFYWSNLLMNDRKAVRTKEFSQSLTPGPLRGLYGLQVEEYRERVRDYAWWSLGATLLIALDAYIDAHLFQFDRDPIPVPNRWDTITEAHDALARNDSGPEGVIVFQWRATF